MRVVQRQCNTNKIDVKIKPSCGLVRNFKARKWGGRGDTMHFIATHSMHSYIVWPGATLSIFNNQLEGNTAG